MNKNKERAKGFIAGVILTILFSSTIAVFANSSVAMEAFFIVNNLVVNGERLELSEEERPFVSEGRAFLPVRAISEALGHPVTWDSLTNSIYINAIQKDTSHTFVIEYVIIDGNLLYLSETEESLVINEGTLSLINDISEALGYSVAWGVGTRTIYINENEKDLSLSMQGVLLMEASPPFEHRFMRWQTVYMLGMPYANAITGVGALGGAASGYQFHDLGGQFKTLTATIGSVDGSMANNVATIRFLGDGWELESFNITRNSIPREVSINVSGVSTLEIRLETESFGLRIAVVDAMVV